MRNRYKGKTDQFRLGHAESQVPVDIQGKISVEFPKCVLEPKFWEILIFQEKGWGLLQAVLALSSLEPEPEAKIMCSGF